MIDQSFSDTYHPYYRLVFYGVENFLAHFSDESEGESVWDELEGIKELKFVECRGFCEYFN